jgi:hypothetical protein
MENEGSLPFMFKVSDKFYHILLNSAWQRVENKFLLSDFVKFCKVNLSCYIPWWYLQEEDIEFPLLSDSGTRLG